MHVQCFGESEINVASCYVDSLMHDSLDLWFCLLVHYLVLDITSTVQYHMNNKYCVHTVTLLL